MKRLSAYLVYIVVLGVATIWMLRYGELLKAEIPITLDPYPVQIYSSIYPIIIGLLIGVPHFVSILRSKGKFVVDWIKLCVVGLPSFFLSIIPLTYYNGFAEHIRWIMTLDTRGQLFTISGIVFGYTIITSLNKIQTSVDNSFLDG